MKKETIKLDHLYDHHGLYNTIYYRSSGTKMDEGRAFAQLYQQVMYHHSDVLYLNDFKVCEPMSGHNSRHKTSFIKAMFEDAKIVIPDENYYTLDHASKASNAIPDMSSIPENTFYCFTAYFFALNCVMEDDTRLVTYNSVESFVRTAMKSLRKDGVALLDFSPVKSIGDIADNVKHEYSELIDVPIDSGLHNDLGISKISYPSLKLNIDAQLYLNRYTNQVTIKYDTIEVLSEEGGSVLATFTVETPFSMVIMIENHIMYLVQKVLESLGDFSKEFEIGFGSIDTESGSVEYTPPEDLILTHKDVDEDDDDDDINDLLDPNVLVIKRKP